jgi:hypothetical protein
VSPELCATVLGGITGGAARGLFRSNWHGCSPQKPDFWSEFAQGFRYGAIGGAAAGLLGAILPIGLWGASFTSSMASSIAELIEQDADWATMKDTLLTVGVTNLILNLFGFSIFNLGKSSSEAVKQVIGVLVGITGSEGSQALLDFAEIFE